MPSKIHISRECLETLITIWSEPNPMLDADGLDDVFARVMDREIRERQAREALVAEYSSEIGKDNE